MYISSGSLPNRPPILEETHTFDRASNRLSRADERPGASLADRDFTFEYDGLDRLTESLRGVWNPGTQSLSSFAAGGHKWDLDMLGNWDKLQTDANGSGTFGGPGDTADDRTYNDVNEVLTRQKTGQSTATPFTYDAAGNMRTQRRGGGGDRVFTHDAWNRLVKVEHDPDQVYGNGDDYTSGEYEYNGLNWRTRRGVDTPGSASGIDQWRTLYYCSHWQMIEERLDDDLDGTDDRVAQQMWGLRYIDDAVLRRVKSLGFGGSASFATYYHITDLQFSSVAMLKANGTLVERNVYDAYGNAKHRWAGDFNNDGLVDSVDQGLLNTALSSTIGGAGYNADIDLDRNGVIDSADNTLFGASGSNVLAAGQISDPAGIDAIVGYSGYLFNSETKLYHVRFRCYSPDLGRWIERDPLGYVDGMNLYEYATSRPMRFTDPRGTDVTTTEDLIFVTIGDTIMYFYGTYYEWTKLWYEFDLDEITWSTNAARATVQMQDDLLNNYTRWGSTLRTLGTATIAGYIISAHDAVSKAIDGDYGGAAFGAGAAILGAINPVMGIVVLAADIGINYAIDTKITLDEKVHQEQADSDRCNLLTQAYSHYQLDNPCGRNGNGGSERCGCEKMTNLKQKRDEACGYNEDRSVAWN